MKYQDDFSVIKEGEVFLDTGASSLKPDVVVNKMNEYYKNYGVNIHRGVYKMSYEASAAFDEAREIVADFINANPMEVVFTRGASNSLNMVATGYGMKHIKEGDEIILSELEHHSNLLPWIRVANQTGAVLKYIPLTNEGRITFENVKKIITDKTKLIAINHVSNVMGFLSPIEEITAYTKDKNIIVSVDAAQSAPMKLVDVKKLGADFVSFSGHKMAGPTGVGVLWGRKELLNSMDPIEVGGAMMDSVELDSFTYKDAPYRFETGTMPIAEVIGLAEAVKYLQTIDMDILEHEQALQRYTVKKLREIPNVEVYNRFSDSGIVTFNVKGVHPHDTATVLDENNVCTRAGHHCAQRLMKWLNVPATVRATFYFYNDESDADALVDAVRKAAEFFAQFEV